MTSAYEGLEARRYECFGCDRRFFVALEEERPEQCPWCGRPGPGKQGVLYEVSR